MSRPPRDRDRNRGGDPPSLRWEWVSPSAARSLEPPARDPDPPLVIRFGRLGDLILTWPSLAFLAHRAGRVDLVTSARYAALMEALPWVRAVWTVEGLGGGDGVSEVMRLAREIRTAGHGEVIDLHGSLRSRILSAVLGGAHRRVSKSSASRRLRIGARVGQGRVRVDRDTVEPFTRRFLRACGSDDDGVPRAPASLLGTRGDCPTLALLPGARRVTKRWPTRRFGELAQLWATANQGRAVVVAGPGEEALAEEVVALSGGTAHRFVDLGLLETLAELSRCHVAVGGDTGLLHLAGAAGANVVGLFGPTGADMGYWPWKGSGLALAPDLPCHPCSLYGDDRCPLDHHACLAELDAPAALRAALEVLGS